MNDKTTERMYKFFKEVDNSGILNEESNIYLYDGYNNKIHKSNIIGTIVPQNSRWGITNGWKVIEVISNEKHKVLKVRKTTPKECFRFMGFSDEDFEKAKVVNSDTQLYKQAGNSIGVPVLEHIIEALFICGILNNNRKDEDQHVRHYENG